MQALISEMVWFPFIKIRRSTTTQRCWKSSTVRYNWLCLVCECVRVQTGEVFITLDNVATWIANNWKIRPKYSFYIVTDEVDNKAPLFSSQMRLFQHLDEKLQHMDRELATNPQFVQKVIQVLCLRVVFLVGIPSISSFCRQFYEIISFLISSRDELQINLEFQKYSKVKRSPSLLACILIEFP